MSSPLSHEELVRLRKAAEILEDRRAKSGIDKWFVPGSGFSINEYPKHKMFFDLSDKHRERVFMASNRAGKSVAGAFEVACHLTGRYPDWWVGRKFDKPTRFWVAGKDKTTTRDTIQKELFGGLGAFGQGMLPESTIVRTWSMQGVPNGIELAQIRHASGGMSELGFKSYDRGVDSFFGTAQDGIWLDEECPEDVYGECLLRTMTTNGLMLTTFTPKKGLTPLVMSLAKTGEFVGSERFIEADENAIPSRAIVMASWDDVPHLDEKAKKEILQGTPAYLRDAVSKGIPTFGEGNVYPMSRVDIECEPFAIPKHYKRWYGLDIGWNWTAAVFMAEDPDSGQMYVTHVYKRDRAEPVIHAAAIKGIAQKWMWGAIDPASKQSTGDGKKMLDLYREAGLNLVKAVNAVDTGIAVVWEALSTSKLKVFKSCAQLFSEFMVYRYENGRIKKDNDHLMDALRYAVMTKDKVARTEEQAISTHGASYGRKYWF